MCGELNKPLFTVFTATFNRAHTLHRVYKSLKSQTYRNFEWVIVDDGSTDDTQVLVKAWQGEAFFPIRYFWQTNQGKHVAFNRGVKEAQGRFFLPLDSDDECIREALERFKFHWNSIPMEQKPLFSGVCGLCEDQYGRLVGNRFPFDITDSDSLEIYYRYGVRGEKWGFQRTDILRGYPFPEFTNVKFIPEGIVWNAIAKTYKIRFVNEVLRKYWSHEFKQTDQLMYTLNTGFDHAAGCTLYYQSCLNEHIGWFRYAPLEFFRSAVLFVRFSLHSSKGIYRSLQKIRNLFSKMLVVLAIPIGVFLYTFEKRNINLVLRYKALFKNKV